VGHSHRRQGVRHPWGLPLSSLEKERKLYIFSRGKTWEQVKLLKDETHFLPAEPVELVPAKAVKTGAV
jgi:hypothetical protein